MKPVLRLPILTLLLVAANIVAAFALLWDPNLVDKFGFDAANPTIQTAITSLFLHQNILHLLGNMVFLSAVGASVELATGWFRFLTVYFLSGLAGEFLHWMVMHKLTGAPPLIGASGCIAGCAGYYAARYTRLRVPIGPNLSASVLTITGAWLLLQVLGAFVRLGDPNASVSYWAHLGGFLTGMMLSLVFRAPDIGQARLDREVLDRMHQRSPAAAALAARRHLEKHPRDLTVLNELKEALEKLDDLEELGPIMLRIYDLTPTGQRRDVIAAMSVLPTVDKISCAHKAMMAREVAPTDPSVAERLLRMVVADPICESEKPDAIFSLAQLVESQDPSEARKLMAQLIAEFPDNTLAIRARARGISP